MTSEVIDGMTFPWVGCGHDHSHREPPWRTALIVVAAEAFGIRGERLAVLVISGLATLVFGVLETSLVRALR